VTVSLVIQARPTTASPGPMSSGTRTPVRPTQPGRQAGGHHDPAVMGKKPRPVFIGLQPRMFWRNWVKKKNIENTAVPMQSISAYAPDRFRLAKMRSGMSGLELRVSMSPNAISRTPAITKGQRCPCSTSYVPKRSRRRRPVNSIPPVAVNRAGHIQFARRGLGLVERPRREEQDQAAIGTLTKKIQRHDT